MGCKLVRFWEQLQAKLNLGHFSHAIWHPLGERSLSQSRETFDHKFGAVTAHKKCRIWQGVLLVMTTDTLWAKCSVLCRVKGELKVISSVCWVQLAVVERLWSKVMNQCTECHSIVPARCEVGYVYMLTHTHTHTHAYITLGGSIKLQLATYWTSQSRNFPQPRNTTLLHEFYLETTQILDICTQLPDSNNNITHISIHHEVATSSHSTIYYLLFLSWTLGVLDFSLKKLIMLLRGINLI